MELVGSWWITGNTNFGLHGTVNRDRNFMCDGKRIRKISKFKFASINRVQYQLYVQNFLNARMPASPTNERFFVLIRDRTNLKLSLDCPKQLIDADDF